MMRLPEFWYRGTEGDQVDIYFKTTQPSDPENWVHWDGNVLIGCYEANYDSTNGLRSISGVQSSDKISLVDFKAYAEAKGKGFQLVDWQMHCIMVILFYAWYGNTNAGAICGIGTNSGEKETGQTDSLGMTDTTAENGNSMSINFWGLENWWGNKSEVMHDAITTGTGITVYNPDTGIFDRDITIDSSLLGLSSFYVSKMKFGKYCDCIMTEANGSETSSYCCLQNVIGASGYEGLRSSKTTAPHGPLYFFAFNSPTHGSYRKSSRLCYRGPFIIHN